VTAPRSPARATIAASCAFVPGVQHLMRHRAERALNRSDSIDARRADQHRPPARVHVANLATGGGFFSAFDANNSSR
jgi:hypothetical protein